MSGSTGSRGIPTVMLPGFILIAGTLPCYLGTISATHLSILHETASSGDLEGTCLYVHCLRGPIDNGSFLFLGSSHGTQIHRLLMIQNQKVYRLEPSAICLHVMDSGSLGPHCQSDRSRNTGLPSSPAILPDPVSLEPLPDQEPHLLSKALTGLHGDTLTSAPKDNLCKVQANMLFSFSHDFKF